MAMVPARVTYVTLGVADVARATAFYKELGWEVLPASEPSITFLRTGGPIVGLFSRDALAEDAGVSAEGSGFRGITVSMNVGSEAEVDAAYEAWLAAGGRSVRAPSAAEWGGYTCYVADVDDHLWEIALNPYLVLDERGLPVHP